MVFTSILAMLTDNRKMVALTRVVIKRTMKDDLLFHYRFPRTMPSKQNDNLFWLESFERDKEMNEKPIRVHLRMDRLSCQTVSMLRIYLFLYVQ